ncbi:MAG: hypothetical protein Q9178_006497 [Gyalolechia marmorata]
MKRAIPEEATCGILLANYDIHNAGNAVPDDLLDPTANPSAPPRESPQSSLPQASLASMTIEDQVQDGSDGPIVVQKFHQAASATPETQHVPVLEPNECQPHQDLFFMDGTGSQVISGKSKLNSPKLPRSLSPTPSNSSEEIIVFTGRRTTRRGIVQYNENNSKTHSQRNNLPKSKDGDNIQANARSTLETPLPTANTIDQPERQTQLSGNYSHSEKSSPNPSQGQQNLMYSTSRSLRGRRKRPKSARQSYSQSVEDEILADYIANMADEGVLNGIPSDSTPNEPLAANLQMRPASPSAAETDGAEEAINSLLDQSPDWDSNDIRDLDDMSTSAEGYSILDKVLASRQRPTGQQYLVVGHAQSIDDARWIPLLSLDSANARECIRAFELTRADFQIGAFSSEESDDSIDDAQLNADLQEDLDSMEDERDLVERRQERMTDEQIARLLSKQEELGLGSSELLLFDGADNDEDEEEPSPAAFIPLKKGRGKKAHQPHGLFAPATMLTDELEQHPYGDFDVMDHDRLSLHRRPKGRRGAPTLDLSDVELEASIQSAWEKDRSKKSMRKRQREELRAQGLLGKSGVPDLNAKYKEGITLHQVRDEIIIFMTSSTQSLALPSMGHSDRKLVHEMANVLRLKSKSSGEGKSRYPMLYKTNRTADFDETAMSNIMKHLNSKRFLPRKEPKGSGKAAAIKRTRGNAGNTAGVSYHDGEVVGAAAPEIGIENRGRAMLEKMGWSKGTALGALNNKGMLQPVTHIVKTTKAGLG